MGWSILLDLRVILAGALIATGLYAAVQRVEKEHVQAEFAQFKADVESEAAKAKVRNAQEALRQAQSAQEVVDDLQNRNAYLSARYDRLRASRASSSSVPPISSAPEVTVSLPGSLEQPDPTLGCLQALEWGDRELSKYAELWRLQEKNAN